MKTRIPMYLGSSDSEAFLCLCAHVTKEIGKMKSFYYCPFTLALLLMVFCFVLVFFSESKLTKHVYWEKKSKYHSDYLTDYKHFDYIKTSKSENS